MAFLETKNNAVSTLNGAILAADVTIAVQVGHGTRFPSAAGANSFMVTVQEGAVYEIMECVSRAGDVLTVVRGQEGTSAQNFSNGAAVSARITAGLLARFFQRTGDALSNLLDIVKSGGTEAAVRGLNSASLRWSMVLGESTTEAGANTGSNFALRRYDDSGSLLSTPISVARNTGLVSLANGLSVTAGLASDTVTVSGAATFNGAVTVNATPLSPAHAATKAYVDTTTATGDAARVAKAGDSMTGTLVVAPGSAAIGLHATGNGYFGVVGRSNSASSGGVYGETADFPTIFGVLGFLNTYGVYSQGPLLATGNVTSNAAVYSDEFRLRNATDCGMSFTGASQVSFVIGGATRLTLTGATLTTPGTMTAADFLISSDERLKTNIATISNALELVRQLRGVSFVKQGVPSMGVIAQEVERVIPCLVTEPTMGNKYVAIQNLVGPLIEAIKELAARVEQLEAR